MELNVYPNHFPKVVFSFSIIFDKDTKLNFDTVAQVKNNGFKIDDGIRNYTTIVGVWLYILASIKYCFCKKVTVLKKLPGLGSEA